MTYDTDYYGWTTAQAALLRAGRPGDADLDHIAEELESMGRSERRELVSRLAVLLTHLLKWQYQPERRGASWAATIRIQRLTLTQHLRDNPSLRGRLPDALADAYEAAAIGGAVETSLPESTFPATCPWAANQVLDPGFWPGQ